MNNFKHTNDIYLYDGTIEGLFTLIYATYKSHTYPSKIYSEKEYIDNIIDTPIYIETNYEQSDIVKESIINKISDFVYENILISFLSHDKDKAIIIYDYLFNAYKYGYKIIYHNELVEVTKFNKMVKNIRSEAHKFKGFVRFTKLKNEIYFSKINPDNDIIYLLGSHFKNRLPNERWIIFDENKHKAIFYDRKILKVVEDIDMNFQNSNDEYEQIWKSFIKAVTIKERKNLRCQRNFMPKKYWKNLLEVNI